MPERCNGARSIPAVEVVTSSYGDSAWWDIVECEHGGAGRRPARFARRYVKSFMGKRKESPSNQDGKAPGSPHGAASGKAST